MHRVAIALILFAALALPAAAKDVHSDCIEKDHKPPGDCGVITEPKILNLYWDTSAAQWDADVAGITANTQARIDAHVLALTHSTYFSQLAQYHVDPPEFLGSVTASGCQPPQAVGGFPDPRDVRTANLLDMALLVDCVKQRQPDKFENVNLVVLLLPAFVKPAWVTELAGEPFIPALPALSCAGAAPFYAGFDAFHIKFGELPVAVIPLQCLGDFPQVLGAISHEIVETMTNSDPLIQNGFVDKTFGDNLGQFGSVGLQPEIADLCEPSASPFLDGSASLYWSQAVMSCVPGFDMTKPSALINSVALCGGGRNMRIIVDGQDFGSMPSDALADSASLSFGYIEMTAPPATGVLPCPFTEPAIGGAAFQAGHKFALFDRGITVSFRSWDTGEIRIDRFGGAFGTPPRVTRPGDVAAVEVANQATGQFACSSAIVPAPTRIVGSTQPPVPAGGDSTVSGTVLDAPNCGHEGVPVTLAASGGSLGPMPAVSDANGVVTSPFTAPDIAGPVTITASAGAPPIGGSWTVPVAPVITAIAPAHVDLAGGTPVSITGRGFVSGATAVRFNGVEASAPGVSSSTRLTVNAPPSAQSGPVNVTVSVRQIPSLALQQVIYVPAFGPYLTFFDSGCGTASIAAEVFDHTGEPVAGEPVTPTAVSGSFGAGAGAASFAADTDQAGRVSTKMMTTADPTALAVRAHTRDRPTPDERNNVHVIAESTCDRFTNAVLRTLPVRVLIGEQLVPGVLDGCQACVDPSRFQVQWKTATPILSGLVLTALTDDAATATNVTVAVLGANKAEPILKRAPTPAQAVTLIEVDGVIDSARLQLQYAASPAATERLALYRLEADKWVAVASINPATRDLAARVSSVGTYAIVAQ
jgi:hypothetical protein